MFCLKLYGCFVVFALTNIVRFVIYVDLYYLFYLGYCKLCFSGQMCIIMTGKKIIHTYSGTFNNILSHSVFRGVQVYLGIFRHYLGKIRHIKNSM